MKIIKSGGKGKIIDTKQFTCTGCGCIFECEPGEYRIEKAGQLDEESPTANCPECD